MTKRITLRLSDNRTEKLLFLYKFFDIHSDTKVERFRELLDALFSYIKQRSETDILLVETEIDLPDCQFYPSYMTKGNHKGMIFCSEPTVPNLKRGNYLELEACQNCFKKQSDEREQEGTPTTRTEFAPQSDKEQRNPTQKRAAYVRKSKREHRLEPPDPPKLPLVGSTAWQRLPVAERQQVKEAWAEHKRKLEEYKAYLRGERR